MIIGYGSTMHRRQRAGAAATISIYVLSTLALESPRWHSPMARRQEQSRYLQRGAHVGALLIRISVDVVGAVTD
jgi:hypothetical protein